MTTRAPTWSSLPHAPLCVATFEVAGGILPLGKSAFGERRVGYITGGTFEGERLRGEILPGGGNWSTTGEIPGGVAGTFDARSVWRTHDGALISVSYAGRSVIPAEVGAAFRDPAQPDVDPSRYYLRIAPVFETNDPRYAWLNGVLAVSCGERLPAGVRHWMFEVK